MHYGGGGGGGDITVGFERDYYNTRGASPLKQCVACCCDWFCAQPAYSDVSFIYITRASNY